MTEIKKEFHEDDGTSTVVTVHCDTPGTKLEGEWSEEHGDGLVNLEIHDVKIQVEPVVDCSNAEDGSNQGDSLVCRHCGLCYMDRGSFNQHVASHSLGTEGGETTGAPQVAAGEDSSNTHPSPKGKRYSCTKCGKQYSSNSKLNDHVSFVHNGEGPKCTICGKMYTSTGSLNMHVKNVHSGKGFQCRRCGRTLANKGSLKDHILHVHVGARAIQCPSCPKSYLSLSALRVHMATAHEDVRFDCPVCGKHYSRRSLLQEHTATVHEGKGLQCGACPKVFTSQRGLKLHTAAVHDGVRFVCSACGADFPNKRNLQRHILSLHERQPFDCAKCGSRFRCSSTLWRHVSAVHKGGGAAEPRPQLPG